MNENLQEKLPNKLSPLVFVVFTIKIQLAQSYCNVNEDTKSKKKNIFLNKKNIENSLTIGTKESALKRITIY